MLPLPRKASTRPQDADTVNRLLTSVIAGHPQATTTYLFYEELDTWLGPWGEAGYPLGYGKFYNLAFTNSARLMANPRAAEWVRRTTIRLQELLRDWLVAQTRAGAIPAMSEAALRQAAFDSHPQAYDEGGLALLTVTDPMLLPIIGTIPSREFNPLSGSFGATVSQVVATIGRVTVATPGNVLPAMAGPAHTGIWQRSMAQDQQRFQGQQALITQLTALRQQVERGSLDYLPVLDHIINRLNATTFPDQGFAALARSVVTAAQLRRTETLARLNVALDRSGQVRARVVQAFPNLLR